MYEQNVIEALALLRTFTGPGGGKYLPGQIVQAVNALDNAGVFAALDEQTDYASATEILAESAPASVPNAADPAEWGDTTSADMARHQGVLDATQTFGPRDVWAARARAIEDIRPKGRRTED